MNLAMGSMIFLLLLLAGAILLQIFLSRRASRWPGLPGTAGWKMDMSLPQMMKQGRCLWYGLRIQKSRFSWL